MKLRNLRAPKGRIRALIGISLGLILVSSSTALSVAKNGHGRNVDPDGLDARAVRDVSSRFRDLDEALAEGYVMFYKCTEQPGVGTMGQHFVNLDYVGDPAINPLRPEVLVYEPTRNGGYKLAAVEYVVLAADWVNAFGPDRKPTVLGQDMLFRPLGNRYDLPDFYERHAWLFKDNPAGMFEDWNPKASCLGTGDNGG
jgi:hypothetical protein